MSNKEHAYTGTEFIDEDVTDEVLEATPFLQDALSHFLHQVSSNSLLNVQEEVEYGTAIQDGLLAEEELIDQDEATQDLIVRVKNGEHAKQQMILSNIKFVVMVAKQYQDRGIELADLVQEGIVGLHRAASDFDPTRGLKFSTYAIWWVEKHIKDAIAKQSRTIRIPHKQLDLLNKINSSEARLFQELGRKPTKGELAKDLDVPEKKLRELIRITALPMSLEGFRFDDDPIDIQIPDDSLHSNPSQSFERHDRDMKLRELHLLEDNEREVIELGFGLNGEEPLQLIQIAKRLDTNQGEVSFIKKRALTKLRHPGLQSYTQLNDKEMAWQNDATCVEIGIEPFFAQSDNITRQARKICLGCGALRQCLAYALQTGQDFGIWGATTPHQRQRLGPELIELL
jgi:RNA polymerase sigma factor (sigma-70 family)